MKTPNFIYGLEYETNCTAISINKWEELMKGATRANKKIIERHVKTHLPDLYEELTLNFYNPYNYYKTREHLILVHSHIEHFIKYF